MSSQPNPWRRRAVAFLWILLALTAVVQVGRLTVHVVDPSSDWFLSTRHPFWAQHECLPAYVFAAELHERGEDNVYHARHYPGLNPEAEPTTRMDGMAPEDPFQYPPQFLLLGKLATSLTQDYTAIRVGFFVFQLALFGFVAFALTSWIGGREGRLAAWLFPLALASFPVLHALQYGQFHLAAVVLGVAALLAFHRGWSPLGGLMLAVAVLSKIFPGILLVMLAGQRRWRDLAWTFGAGVALTALALAVLGPAPFVAFFDYHLPRLADGQAFAFDEAWPEIHELMVADNQGVRGLVLKLEAMGLPGLGGDVTETVAAVASQLYGLLILALAFGVGWAGNRLPRVHRAASWLALLGLASLASAGAFGDYVPLTATWMLTILAPTVRWRSATGVWVALAGVFQLTLLGTTPIGSWFQPGVMIPLSAVGSVLLFGLFGWALLRPLASRVAEPFSLRRWHPSPG